MYVIEDVYIADHAYLSVRSTMLFAFKNSAGSSVCLSME